jgi:hypothetical protein
MGKLVWNAAGQRFYEAGVDRGVLYPVGSEGVAWNGLVRVTEKPSGAKSAATYLDGVKSRTDVDNEDYEATIEAYTYPDAFAASDGTAFDGKGLAFGLQPKKPFSLSYRSMVGNDLKGLSLGYKIHLVYDAMASPSQKDNKTLEKNIDPSNFSWDISATPRPVTNRKPTAHLTIDSRTTNPDILAVIEGYLYGANGLSPRMPTPKQLQILFGQWPSLGLTVPLTFIGMVEAFEWVMNYVPNPSMEKANGTIEISRNLFTNPTFDTAAASLVVRSNLALNSIPVISTALWASGVALTRVQVGSQWCMNAPMNTYTYASAVGVVGKFYAASMKIYGSVGTTVSMVSTDNAVGDIFNAVSAVIPAAGFITLVGKASRAVAGTALNFGIYNPTAAVKVTEAYLEEVSGVGAGPSGPYFDANMGNSGDYTYAWAGAVNASASIQRATGLASLTSGASVVYRSGEWASSGSYSLRVGSRYFAIGSGFAEITPPGITPAVAAGKTYTIMAKVRIAEALSEFPGIQVTEVIGASVRNVKADAPSKLPGVYDLRLVATLAPTTTALYMRLYNNNIQGSPDVWFDDVLIVEGNYQGPFYTGSTPAAGDYTYSWLGAVGGSESIITAPVVEPFTSPFAGAVAFQSKVWSSNRSKSVRIALRAAASITNSAVEGPYMAFIAGKTYTIKTKIRITKTHTGTGAAMRQLRIPMPTAILSPRAPAAPGVYQIEWTFVADVTGTYPIQFWHGGSIGDDDIWFDDFMIIDGNKTSLMYFDGSMAPFVIDGQKVYPYWQGAVDASRSVFQYINALPTNPQEGYAFVADDNLWVYKNGQWKNYGSIFVGPYPA